MSLSRFRSPGRVAKAASRVKPKRGNPDIFEHHGFITGVKDGFVEFSYHGWHQELVRRRITPDDVHWASELMAGLTDTLWADAFRAGGYDSTVATRFIRRLQQRIAEGLQMGEEQQ